MAAVDFVLSSNELGPIAPRVLRVEAPSGRDVPVLSYLETLGTQSRPKYVEIVDSEGWMGFPRRSKI